MNIVILQGRITSEPDFRELASGAKTVSFELTTVDSEGVPASVPVTLFDPPAAFSVTEGEQVTVIGNVRRRFFRAHGLTQSRTEVIAETVVTYPDAVAAAIDAAVKKITAR